MIKKFLQNSVRVGHTFITRRLVGIRTRWYRLLFCELGEKSAVLGSISVLSPKNISVGYNTTLNTGCFLNARDHIQIGNFVHVSPFVIMNTGGLDYSKRLSERQHIKGPIIIEDGVWIGSGVIINPRVRIGAHSVIGAGAVVTKDIPANVVAVGVPAKVIKEISDENHPQSVTI